MTIRRLRRKSGNTVVSVWPPPWAFSLRPPCGWSVLVWFRNTVVARASWP